MTTARRQCAETTQELPFLFEPAHHELCEQARQFAFRALRPDEDRAMAQPPPAPSALVQRCRWVARQLGAGKLLALAVPARLGGRLVAAPAEQLDARGQALAREALAYATGPTELLFAVQCLVGHVLTAAGTQAQQRELVPGLLDGTSLGGFAIAEPSAGSDPTSIATTARREGDGYVLRGAKSYVLLAGAAEFFFVLARTSEHRTQGLTGFWVRAADAGVRCELDAYYTGEQPLGGLHLDEVRVAASRRVGNEGDGLRIATQALDAVRCTVAAAAVGLARRALDDALVRVSARQQFGRPLAELQLTRAALAEMSCDVEAARLLAYRAAYARDLDQEHVSLEGAQAKLFATEAAQRVVDRAVQLFGAAGVTRGTAVERLYREVRALRLYEGPSEVQKLVIAGVLLGEERARVAEERAALADRGTTRQLRSARLPAAGAPAPPAPGVDVTQRQRALRGPSEEKS